MRPLPYAFLVGAACPALIYLLHRLLPRAKFHLWNTTIFFSGASIFYGNVSTGYFSRFIGGFVVMYWAYRYRYKLWAKCKCLTPSKYTLEFLPGKRFTDSHSFQTTSSSPPPSTQASTSTCCSCSWFSAAQRSSVCQIGGVMMRRAWKSATRSKVAS